MRALPAILATSLLLPVSAMAQDRAGVVTTVQGTATVARTSTPDPAPLRFKDDVFARDVIRTGEKSFVRVLLGGKATVSAREHTVLTITEVPGTATINLTSGRIAVAVSKDKMRPGETVEIATPNSVAAIRGTVVFAEVFPGQHGGRSVITVLRGLIDVTRLDPSTGARVGAPVLVGALQTISVLGLIRSPLPQPTTITKERAQGLSLEFTVIPTTPPAASIAPAVERSMAIAAQDVAAVLPVFQSSSGDTTSTASGSSSSGNTNADDNTSGSATAGSSANSNGSANGSGSATASGSSGNAHGNTNDNANGNSNGSATASGNGSSTNGTATANSSGSSSGGNSNGSSGSNGSATASGNSNGNSGGNGNATASGNSNGNNGGNGNATASSNSNGTATASGNAYGIGNANGGGNASGSTGGNGSSGNASASGNGKPTVTPTSAAAPTAATAAAATPAATGTPAPTATVATASTSTLTIAATPKTLPPAAAAAPGKSGGNPGNGKSK